MKMRIKSEFNSGGFYSKKFLMIVSLMFMIALIFSSFISMFSIVSPFTLGSEDYKVINSVEELVSTVAAVPDGTTCVISLGRDITLKDALVIHDGQNITLVSAHNNAKFYKLSGAEGENTITVENGGELRLDGIVVTHADNAIGRGVEVDFGGTLVMYSGEIFNNNATDGGGVYNEGTFIMSGGKISGNTAIIGGGVYNFWGNFSMFGGEITGNTAEYFGGGVNSPGDFSRLGGVISGNTANGSVNDVDGVVVDAWPDSNKKGYLLFITIIVVVAIFVVGGLLVYHLKNQKQFVTQNLSDST